MLFPAQAGVILYELNKEVIEETFPRAGGGDPNLESEIQDTIDFSPRRRG